MFFHYAYFSRIFILLCFYGCNCVDVQRFRVSLYHIDGLYKQVDSDSVYYCLYVFTDVRQLVVAQTVM